MKYIKSFKPEIGDYVICDLSTVFTQLNKNDTFFNVNEFLKSNIGRLINILKKDDIDILSYFFYIVEYDDVPFEISHYFSNEKKIK